MEKFTLPNEVCIHDIQIDSNKHSTFTATGWLAKPLEKLSVTNLTLYLRTVLS